MAPIHVFPETMMKAIRSDFDKHKEIPGPRRHEMSHNTEALSCHLVDLVQQPCLIVCTKVVHVQHVLSNEIGYLMAQFGRIGVLAVDGWSQEARHNNAVGLFDRISLRYTHQADLASVPGQDVPDSVSFD